ncbi:MAG TPA: hypothetical protein VKI65_11590, partial [Gemmataceae bacterium]|nr:hypothetical protein [Gemmataceae bacterium]
PRKPPQPQALRDLATPPELAEVIADARARYPHDPRWIDEELKLQYYYGGLEVLCAETPEGREVLAAGSPEEVGNVLRSVSREQWNRVMILSPAPWNEVVICSPVADED